MKRILLAALLLIASPAIADVGIRYTPLGYCQLTSIDTAVLLSSCSGFPATATRAVFIPEAQAIRYRDDGTAPTTTVGQPVAVGVTVDYTGALSKVQVISQTSGAKLNVLFYK
jgi:hypothetical protein